MNTRADSVQAFERLGELFSFAASRLSLNPLYSVQNLVTDLHLADEHKLRIGAASQTHAGFVQLMTAHRAKGMEFEHVFVVGVVDKVWGGNSERNLFALPVGSVQGTAASKVVGRAYRAGRHMSGEREG